MTLGDGLAAKPNKNHRENRPAAGDVYPTECLLDKWDKGRQVEFLVQWEGDYPPSWEPDNHVYDGDIAIFQEKYKGIWRGL